MVGLSYRPFAMESVPDPLLLLLEENNFRLQLLSLFCCGNFVGPTDYGSPTPTDFICWLKSQTNMHQQFSKIVVLQHVSPTKEKKGFSIFRRMCTGCVFTCITCYPGHAVHWYLHYLWKCWVHCRRNLLFYMGALSRMCVYTLMVSLPPEAVLIQGSYSVGMGNP